MKVKDKKLKENSKSISIFWYRTEIFYNPYKRWIDLWMED